MAIFNAQYVMGLRTHPNYRDYKWLLAIKHFVQCFLSTFQLLECTGEPAYSRWINKLLNILTERIKWSTYEQYCSFIVIISSQVFIQANLLCLWVLIFQYGKSAAPRFNILKANTMQKCSVIYLIKPTLCHPWDYMQYQGSATY